MPRRGIGSRVSAGKTVGCHFRAKIAEFSAVRIELFRQFMDKAHADAKALPVREWEVQYSTTLMQLSGKKAVHC
jgi:hypothetical protein